MIRLAGFGVWCAIVACGRSGGVPDDQLGGLVMEAKAGAKIDVALAGRDPAELSRALAVPHASVIAALGPHAASVDTRNVVDEGGKQVSELSDHAAIEIGDAGGFHAVYSNSADYGREVIFAGGKLYLRPKYQRWHGRAPESPDEPGMLRDQYFAAIAATWDLVAPGAELTDRGAIQIAGRTGRKIEVRLAPTPRENPRESVSQRRWREGRTVGSLAGEVILDAEHGVPLKVLLTGSVAFSRDGRRFVMKLGVDATVISVGATAITAPPEAEVVATPERLREVDERDFLLRDIAPSIRKNPDGTAMPPVPPQIDGSTKPPDKPLDADPQRDQDRKRDRDRKRDQDRKRDDTPDATPRPEDKP